MGSIKADSGLAANRLIGRLPQLRPGAHYRLAYSGGLDSTVLLHALRALPQLRAVHVNHGMQAQADEWQAHCRARCRQWGIPIDIRAVTPDVGRGGPEAGARDARYHAFRQLMQAGDVLLVAQHCNDQAETFLLQALRGAGVRGLAGMPQGAPFGPGRLLRPLLDISRQQIRQYAIDNALDWVEDPSNADPAVARAWLRREIVPEIARDQPQFERRLARSAAWCAEASELSDDLAEIDAQYCAGPGPECLAVDTLSGLSGARRSNLLRYWLRQHGLTPPDHRHLQQMHLLIESSRPDAQPMVAWQDAQLRRAGNWLFAMPALPAVPSHFSRAWSGQHSLALAPGCGWLDARHWNHGEVTVRLRRGGERLHLRGRAHSSSLKQLLQSAGVPVWIRERMPLLFKDDQLIAVADYWQHPDYAAGDGGCEAGLIWRDAPVGANLGRVVAAEAFR